MSDPDFTHAVFLSRSPKDKAVVRVSSLSASNEERMRCRNGHFAAGPMAASRQSAAFSVCRQTQKQENGGALPRRRYAGKIGEGLERAQPTFQPSAFILRALLHGSLAQFLYINWRTEARNRECPTPAVKRALTRQSLHESEQTGLQPT